jgi:hypothetical protein
MEDKNNPATERWILDENSNPDPAASPYIVEDVPIPFNLDFQIRVQARTYQQTFQIIDQLSERSYLPARFGFLEVPEDGTIRTLELSGGPEVTPDNDQDGKRVLLTLYSVRVASEKNLYEIEQIQRARTVTTNLEHMSDPASEGD